MVRRRREALAASPDVRNVKEAPWAPSDHVENPGRAVTLEFPYGFIDEAGRHRLWQAGELVHDAAALDLLRERGAHLMEG